MSAARRRNVALEVGVTAAIVAGVWLYCAGDHGYTVVSVPTILRTFRETWLFSHFGSDVVPSLTRLALGYGLACAIGVIAGLGLGLSPTLRDLAHPVLSFARSIPAVALFPLAIVLLGIGTSMKVSIIAFTCCWPILLNTADGVAELDATLVRTARVFDLSRWDRLRLVTLPAASPRILTGMKSALSLAVLLLVVGEMVASTNGIGYFVFHAQQTFAIADMWAGVLLLGLIGFTLNALFDALQRRLLRWHVGQAAGGEAT